MGPWAHMGPYGPMGPWEKSLPLRGQDPPQGRNPYQKMDIHIFRKGIYSEIVKTESNLLKKPKCATPGWGSPAGAKSVSENGHPYFQKGHLVRNSQKLSQISTFLVYS